MVAALKPGGRLVVEDIDYRGSFARDPLTYLAIPRVVQVWGEKP
jgi:hypothetical protein